MTSAADLSRKCVGIIGVGNMGEAILANLLKSGHATSQIYFAEKSDERAAEILSKYEVKRKNISELAATCDAILLIVKPQDLLVTLEYLLPAFRKETLVVSFIAGKKIATIEGALGSGIPVIRVMPNTPALIGRGMAAISLGAYATPADLSFVRIFLSAGGKVIEVDEISLDAVTATSGSGPAYLFRFVEAMIEGAVRLGLSEEVATELTIATIVGSAAMLTESGKSPTTLRENVTSPNGTTAAALKVFNESGLTDLVSRAMQAASDRSTELA